MSNLRPRILNVSLEEMYLIKDAANFLNLPVHSPATENFTKLSNKWPHICLDRNDALTMNRGIAGDYMYTDVNVNDFINCLKSKFPPDSLHEDLTTIFN